MRTIWLAYLLLCIATWVVLRSLNILVPDQYMQVSTLKLDLAMPTMSREEGLARLDALIELKRVPENCEDVMRFLEAFKKHKGEWGVTGEDLKRMYMTKCSWMELLRQWKTTCDCCWDYRSYID